MKVKSFAVTLNPLNGVDDGMVKRFEKWVRSKCEFYHVVTEKEGSRKHIHAGLFLKKEYSRSDLCVTLIRLFKSLNDDEKRVFRSGIKVMYNIDFIRNYLDKDDDTVVICSCLPEASHLEGYFPKREETKSTISRHSKQYHELESLWNEHVPPGMEVNSLTCRNFLFDMMYNKRLINVIRDDKQIVQVSRHLTRWLHKATESTIELAPFEKEE